jgi:hypothetical protein
VPANADRWSAPASVAMIAAVQRATSGAHAISNAWR